MGQSGGSQLRLAADTAQEFTDALGQVFAGGIRLAGLADDLGIPAALGLSEREWLDRRLAGQVELSLDEKRRVVAELTTKDMTVRDISDATGIPKSTVHRLQQPELVPDGTSEPRRDADPVPEPVPDGTVPDDGRRLGFMLSSASDEWETPQPLFDALDAEFKFKLDVCALPTSAKCRRYFTPDDDGLARTWKGACWMNPPYGDEIARWVKKAWESADAGATVVCLVPARVDTGWWWDYCRFGEIRFIRGRLKFGDSGNAAPFPSAVVVFRRGGEPRVQWWEWQ